jgi:hypothetical protein
MRLHSRSKLRLNRHSRIRNLADSGHRMRHDPRRFRKRFRTTQKENDNHANCPCWRAHHYVLSVSEVTLMPYAATTLARENIERF